MNEEHLRAHLAELEAKGMNTRGVLRKLLQKYCKDNNLSAAKEIAAKCEKEGVSRYLNSNRGGQNKKNRKAMKMK